MNTLLVACSLVAAVAAPRSLAQSQDKPAEHAIEGSSLRILDIRDLLKSDLDGSTFEMSVMTMVGDGKGGVKVSSGTKSPPDSSASEPEKPRPTEAELLAKRASAMQEMLTTWLRPPPAKGDTLKITSDGTLIANLSAEGQQGLDRFLAVQRESKYMVILQLDFLTGPRGEFDRFVTGKTPCVIAADDAKKLLAEARGGDKLKVASSTPLVGWVRITNHIAQLIPSSYIQDWSVEHVEPGHQSIAVPQIGRLEDGSAADVRAVPLDASHVGLEIDATHMTVKRPITTKKVKLAGAGEKGGEYEVEIALPEVSKVSLKSHLALELGGYALFSGMSDGDNTVAVLVHVERQQPGSAPLMQTVITSNPKKPPTDKR